VSEQINEPAAQVRAGQVWKSTDSREHRHVLVESVDSGYAQVVACGPDGRVWGTARRGEIRLRPDGARINRYVLVKDAA